MRCDSGLFSVTGKYFWHIKTCIILLMKPHCHSSAWATRHIHFHRNVRDSDKCSVAIMATCSQQREQKKNWKTWFEHCIHSAPNVNRHIHCKGFPIETGFQHAIVRNAFGRQSGKLNGAIVNVNNLLAILMNCSVQEASPLLLTQINEHASILHQLPPDHKPFTRSPNMIHVNYNAHFNFGQWKRNRLSKKN